MIAKILIITPGGSRQGGILEVSRQVEEILSNEPSIQCRILKIPSNRILRTGLRVTRLQDIWVNLMACIGYHPMFMHVNLFERLCLSRLARMGSFVWAHGIEVWGNFGRVRTLQLPGAKCVLSVSRFTTQKILHNHPEAKVETINLTIAHRKTPEEVCDKPSVFEIITVGRLAQNEQYKGHDLVIEALRKLSKRGIRIPYHIVGTGDDMPRLKSLARNLGVEDLVNFHGYVLDSQIGDLYNRSSVFVMPSYVIRRENDIWGGEGFGLVYLEAALHALPVIACNEGGQTDCVIHEQTGLLLSPDADEIAQAIQNFHENPERCRQMGQTARQYALENHSPDRFRKNLLEILWHTLQE